MMMAREHEHANAVGSDNNDSSIVDVAGEVDDNDVDDKDVVATANND